MDEDVCIGIGRDETVALVVVEPFDVTPNPCVFGKGRCVIISLRCLFSVFLDNRSRCLRARALYWGLIRLQFQDLRPNLFGCIYIGPEQHFDACIQADGIGTVFPVELAGIYDSIGDRIDGRLIDL